MTHQDFQLALLHSEPARFAVARYLCEVGNDVLCPRLRIAPTSARASDFSDDGDLLVTDERGRRLRYEVKHLKSVSFTNLSDWPFRPRGEFIICPVRGFDDAVPPIDFIVSVSKEMTHAGIVDCGEKRSWTVATLARGVQVYVTKPARVRFVSLEPDLERALAYSRPS